MLLTQFQTWFVVVVVVVVVVVSTNDIFLVIISIRWITEPSQLHFIYFFSFYLVWQFAAWKKRKEQLQVE